MSNDYISTNFWFSFTFQVLLPPYEEVIAIPPKEPPPQYMEAWAMSSVLDPTLQTTLYTTHSSLPESDPVCWKTLNNALDAICEVLCSPLVSSLVQGRFRDNYPLIPTSPPSREVPTAGINSCTPWPLCPRIICTFLKRAPVWPPTVNPQYCESPSWSLSTNKLPE